MTSECVGINYVQGSTFTFIYSFILLQILHLFEEPEHWLEMHKKREELPGALGKGEMDDSDPHDFWVIYDK